MPSPYSRDTFTVELAPPPPALSPNARSKRARIAATAAYRDSTYARAREILGRKPAPRWVGAEADVTFYVRDRRKRDPDNLAAMLKPAWDGLVRAGILQDDADLTVWPILIRVDRQRQRVRVRLHHRPPGSPPVLYRALAGMAIGLFVYPFVCMAQAGYRDRLLELRQRIDLIYPRDVWPAATAEPGGVFAWALRAYIDRLERIYARRQ